MSFRVRRARIDDLSALIPMMVEFNQEDGIAWSPATGEAALRRLLEDEQLGVVGLAESDGATAGYFVLTWGYDLEWNGRDSYLTELYLRPEARGRGLGQVLLRASEEMAQHHGARALHLMVRPENAAAVALYARAGYQPPPRRFLSKGLG
ncbi:MAG: GNAT family N-acetyltransferase [Myxococcaceae bacterium]